jgi:hypothetical protein
MELLPLGGYANLESHELAIKTKSSLRSVRRWKQTGLAPAIVIAWLDLIHYGNLGAICAEFEGWALRRGTLHAPNGWTFSAGQLMAIPLHYQREAALETALLSTAKPTVLAARRKLTLSHFSRASSSTPSPLPLPSLLEDRR